MSPREEKVHLNPEGERVIKLDPVNLKEWKNPELQALEVKIRESRARRVEERLANLKEERLYFSNPILTLKENGQELVTLDVKFKGGIQKINFLSPKGHGEHFYFERISGFEDRRVRLQGMCLDTGETCNNLAIQVSYLYKRLKITEQFIVNTGLEEKEPAEASEIDEITTVDDPSPDSTIEDSEVTEEMDSGEADLITVDDENENKPEIDLSSIPALSTPPVEDNINSVVIPKTDSPVIRNTPNPLAPVDISRDSVISPDLPTPPNSENNNAVDISETKTEADKPKIDLSTGPVLSPPNIEDNTSSVVVSKTDQPVTINRPNQLAPIDISRDTLPTLDLSTPPAPKDDVAIDISETDADPETQTSVDLDHSENNTDLIIGDGQIIFPHIPEVDSNTPEPQEADEEFNINSGETNAVTSLMQSIRPVARPANGQNASNERLISDIKNKKYNQSKGFYSAHAVRGRISDASQLRSDLRGVVANPNRRHRQYASGMMTSILKLAADKLDARYPNSPLCVNDIASRNGGKLGGHGSHRNGLDADISYPSTSNKCRGSYFHSWNGMKDKDSKFLEKNWYFINTLLDTERVHVIFVSRHFAASLCTYVKTNTNISKSSRNKIFKKLHHVDGHHHHYHIRLQCNRQNPGCITQGPLTGLTCN